MKAFPIPSLEKGETILESWLANRAQWFRAVGGCLYLTNRRMAFEPHIVDAKLGGKKCSLDFAEISKVGLEPGSFKLSHFFDGGLRTRLRVEKKSGRTEYFVVPDPEKMLLVISRAVSSLGRSLTA